MTHRALQSPVTYYKRRAIAAALAAVVLVPGMIWGMTSCTEYLQPVPELPGITQAS